VIDPEEMKIKSYTIDLSEQMAVCDANYIRLLKLLGKTRGIRTRLIALPGPGLAARHGQILVSLEIQEDFKYTSTICIRQLLNSQEGRPSMYKTPEMIIRVYHDAKTAEVTSYQNHRYFKAAYPVPNRFMYQCDEREQLNLFLAEWLNLCINEGMSNPGELQLEKLNCN
jgi:uncharacterized protein YqiB (DUF1249 family)